MIKLISTQNSGFNQQKKPFEGAYLLLLGTAAMYYSEKKAKFRGIFRGKFAEKSADFAGFSREKSQNSRNNRPILAGENQNSRENRPISRDFSGKKSVFEGFSGANS